MLIEAAGSLALLGARIDADVFVVKKLRAAGAIILGKSNLGEWLKTRSFNRSNGWSAVGGQCYGPYYPGQDPSGSSSGSAVGTTLGLAAAALGTETDGSVVSPAEVNNIVGIRPTKGLVSHSRVIGGRRYDTVGLLARTVRDAATVLQAIAGKDLEDKYTSAIPHEPLPVYAAACKPGGLKGKRIGIPRNLIVPGDGEGPIVAAFDDAVKTVRSLGATVVDHLSVTASALNETLNSNILGSVLGPDFITTLADYLARLTKNPNHVKNLADIRRFTRETEPGPEEYPERDTGVWDLELSLPFNDTSPEYWAYVQRNTEIGGIESITGLLGNFGLDALLLPTAYSPDLPARVGTPIVTIPSII